MAYISAIEREEILEKCYAALEHVQWNHNETFDADTTISKAIQSARMGKDAGLHGAVKLVPATLNFHDWMDYVHLITIYYNFGKPIKKFTILRKRVVYLNKLHRKPAFGTYETMC